MAVSACDFQSNRSKRSCKTFWEKRTRIRFGRLLTVRHGHGARNCLIVMIILSTQTAKQSRRKRSSRRALGSRCVANAKNDVKGVITRFRELRLQSLVTLVFLLLSSSTNERNIVVSTLNMRSTYPDTRADIGERLFSYHY